MCTTDFASEESKNGGTTVDSVALRVMTQQDGCECEVSLKTNIVRIQFTREKDKTPIKCTKGTDTRSVSLLPYGVLHLRSKIIGGNFSRGYCLQIYRHHITGDNVRIQINCSIPSMKTTTQQDKTVSGTENIHSHTDTDSTLYIAIGVGSAVVVIALFVVVAIVIIRRKGNENKYENQIQPDNECIDDDSDGLKYNSLYNSSEQHDIMEGDYHTVKLEGTKNRTGIQKLGSDNSAVDGNYSSIAIVNIHAKDGSKTDSRMKSSSTTTPRLETQRTEEETRKN
ncbi:unnamed protein product [Mytilus edulis]|uniref:Uncharacterized protein n=1 Tax=Mytilus edulis TaxID=6550 RepID=A0A8S3TVY4_MYTED|nr:unnamed protein product [Mytilus edulis]